MVEAVPASGAAALPAAPDMAALREAAREMSAIPGIVQQLALEHGRWNAAALNLVASHNYMSPAAQAMLSSSFSEYIMSGALGFRNHAGSAWVDALDELLVGLAKQLFGARHVEYRPMSGALANGIALAGLLRAGDTAMALPARVGGHHTYREDGYGQMLGYRVIDIPFDETRHAIDLDRLEEVARRERPKAIMVGTAVLLFPYRLKELRAIADTVGARLFYDGAHILGLVAGGQFQDPLREGAEFLTGSAQKTLGGPIGGLVLTTDTQTGEQISRMTSALLSNYHNNRIAGLVVTLAEMAQFGRDYAAQVVANARALSAALHAQGIAVHGLDRGPTCSHVVLIDATKLPNGENAYRLLEQARILTTRIQLPSSYPQRGGIRLGTAGMTRLGAREADMEQIARLIARVVRNGEPPSAVALDVTDFVGGFDHVHYCF